MKGPRHLNFIRAAQSRSVSLCLFFLASSLRNTYFPAEIVFPFISQNMTNLIYQEQIVPSKVVFLINSGLVKFLSDRKHSKWFKLWRSGLNSLILLLSFYVTLGKMLYFFKPRSPMWKRRIAALSQFMPVLRIQQSVDWLRDVYAHLWEGTYKNTLKRLQIHEWDPTKLGICITFGRHTGGIHSPRVSPQGLGKSPNLSASPSA